MQTCTFILYNYTITYRIARLLRSLKVFIQMLKSYTWRYVPNIYVMTYRSVQMQSSYMDQVHIFCKGKMN